MAKKVDHKDAARVRKIKRSKEKIQELLLYIRDLQDECPHPFLKKKNKGDTGNYDPSYDSYWSEYYCNVCDKHWTGDQKYEPGVEECGYGEELKCQMLTDDQLRQS